MGLTVLLVEQNVKKALSIADRGYVLVGGKIVLEAPAEKLAKENIEKLFLGQI